MKQWAIEPRQVQPHDNNRILIHVTLYTRYTHRRYIIRFYSRSCDYTCIIPNPGGLRALATPRSLSTLPIFLSQVIAGLRMPQSRLIVKTLASYIVAALIVATGKSR